MREKFTDGCLGDLGKWITGSTPSTTKKEFWGGDVPFVTPSDIGLSGLLGEVGRRISRLGSEQVRVVNPPSVLLVCIGTIGKVAWTDQIITTNQQINTLQVDIMKNDPRFVMYLLSTPGMQKKLWAASTGTTVSLLNKSNLEKIKVRIPSLEKQRQIVEGLDAALGEVDSLDTILHSLDGCYRRLKESWHAGYLSDDGNTIRLGDICTVTSSKRIFKNEYVSDGVPFYRTKELKELANNKKIKTELYISKERFTEIKERFGSPIDRDILISAVGTIGEVLLVQDLGDFYFKDGNIVWLRGISKEMDSKFLVFCLTNLTDLLNRTAKGTAYSALTIEKLVEIKLPKRSLIEQREIVGELGKAFSMIEDLKGTLSKMKDLAAFLRQSLLSRAFSFEEEVEDVA